MIATAEIDKSGRFVVPKKLRDELHLTPGLRLTIRKSGSGFLVEPEAKPRGLYRKNGRLVYDGGPLPPEHVNWLDEDREERLDYVAGLPRGG